MLETRRRAAIEAPRGVEFLGRECPPPQPTRGIWESVVSSPQRGPGQSPGRQRILGIFRSLRSLLVEIVMCEKLLDVRGAN